MKGKTILLCAGGTGGHLFPAEAVAHEMKARGYLVHLAADDRVAKFAGHFPADKIHQIRSATIASKNPLAIARAMMALLGGYLQSRALLKQIRPDVVAGFGGYPTVPPLLAATRNGIPTLVHEANAVLGRANRFLGKRVNKVAIGFGNTSLVGDIEVTVTGNPVRPDILKRCSTPYPERGAEDPFNLLVFGGSQGAQFFSTVLPMAITTLTPNVVSCIRLVQQARPEDRDELIETYARMSLDAEVDTFFGNMAEQLEKAHLVISRAGASTVSELAVMGRPAILVPYPHALDHDQAANASAMAEAGGAQICPQAKLDAIRLAKELTKAVSEPKKLATAAKNAKKTGKPDATRVLADMLEALANKK